MLQPDELLALIDRLEHIRSFTGHHLGADMARELQALRERVRDDVFRIAVVGEFSSGKSTFINALLGVDLLSHAVSETTAAVTRICHVPLDHPMLGKGEIVFRSGETAVLHDWNTLPEYTTAQSSRNVTEEIRSVSVYTHFMDTNHPIQITDTPGLNGIADKHREITLEEVRSAHACIYLLPRKGVTASDRDFLFTLRRYQSCFLFVHNFMDELNPSEGDSPDKMLAADREAVESVLGGAEGAFRCRYCAVSALKALAARDRKITRLYDGDAHLLTEEDRVQLEESSGLADFEACLNRMISSGTYRTIALESVRQALCAQIERVLPDLEAQNGLRRELRRRDVKNVRIQNAEAIITRLEEQRGDRERRLRQFVVSRDKENRQGLHAYARRRLEELFQWVEQDIDQNIKHYDGLCSFSLRTGEEPPEYYAHQITKQLNGALIPDLNQNAGASLRHLYEEALRQASHYGGRIALENGILRLELELEPLRFDPADDSHTARQRERQRKAVQLEQENIRLGSAMQYGQELLEQIQQEANQVSSAMDTAEQQHKTRMRQLGRKPDVTVTKEKRVEHYTGPFGGLLEAFLGPKSEYEVDVRDDSARRAWQRKARAYAAELERKRAEYQNKISPLNAEIRTLKDSLDLDRAHYAQNSRRAAELQAQIQREEDIYQNILTKRKGEYCQLLKRKLKESLRSRLLDPDAPDSSLCQLMDRIDYASEHSLPGMIDQSILALRRGLEEKIAEFRLIQAGDAAQLDAKYAMCDDDIQALKAIQNEIEQGGHP